MFDVCRLCPVKSRQWTVFFSNVLVSLTRFYGKKKKNLTRLAGFILLSITAVSWLFGKILTHNQFGRGQTLQTLSNPLEDSIQVTVLVGEQAPHLAPSPPKSATSGHPTLNSWTSDMNGVNTFPGSIRTNAADTQRSRGGTAEQGVHIGKLFPSRRLKPSKRLWYIFDWHSTITIHISCVYKYKYTYTVYY